MSCVSHIFESCGLRGKCAKVRIDVLNWNSKEVPRIRWFFGENFFYGTDKLNEFSELRFRAERTSVYESLDSKGKFSIASVEHLAPVFLMWKNRSFDVVVEESVPCVYEVPMMDGSAIPFFHGLRRAAGVPDELAFYDVPLCEGWVTPFGYVRFCPSETFEVEYLISRPDFAGGFESHANVSVYSAEDLYGILSSRTFIFKRDYDLSKDRLASVDMSSGLLLDDCTGGGFSVRTDSVPKDRTRFANEFAMHKILDLLGDLSFALNALPKIRIEILNGGHACHNEIMRRILPYAVFCQSEKI